MYVVSGGVLIFALVRVENIVRMSRFTRVSAAGFIRSMPAVSFLIKRTYAIARNLFADEKIKETFSQACTARNANTSLGAKVRREGIARAFHKRISQHL